MLKVVLIGFVISLLTFPQPAQAADMLSPGMLSAEKRLNNLSGVELCVETWNVLWPLAKEGDLQARMALVWQVMPLMHMDMVVPPGRSGDYISKMRDARILFAHGLGAWIKNSEAHKDIKLFSFIFEGIGSEKFNECISEERYDECAAIAVEENKIPSFESYAAEMDALAAQGFKPSCIEDGRNWRSRKE